MSVIAIFKKLLNKEEIRDEDIEDAIKHCPENKKANTRSALKAKIAEIQQTPEKIQQEGKSTEKDTENEVKKLLAKYNFPEAEFNFKDYLKLREFLKLEEIINDFQKLTEETILLISLFGNIEKVIEYFEKFEKEHPNMKLALYNSYTFPRPSSTEWNPIFWRNLALKYMPSKLFTKIFPHADKLEKYLKAKQKVKTGILEQQRELRRQEIELEPVFTSLEDFLKKQRKNLLEKEVFPEKLTVQIEEIQVDTKTEKELTKAKKQERKGKEGKEGKPKQKESKSDFELKIEKQMDYWVREQLGIIGVTTKKPVPEPGKEAREAGHEPNKGKKLTPEQIKQIEKLKNSPAYQEQAEKLRTEELKKQEDKWIDDFIDLQSSDIRTAIKAKVEDELLNISEDANRIRELNKRISELDNQIGLLKDDQTRIAEIKKLKEEKKFLDKERKPLYKKFQDQLKDLLNTDEGREKQRKIKREAILEFMPSPNHIKSTYVESRLQNEEPNIVNAAKMQMTKIYIPDDEIAKIKNPIIDKWMDEFIEFLPSDVRAVVNEKIKEEAESNKEFQENQREIKRKAILLVFQDDLFSDSKVNDEIKKMLNDLTMQPATVNEIEEKEMDILYFIARKMGKSPPNLPLLSEDIELSALVEFGKHCAYPEAAKNPRAAKIFYSKGISEKGFNEYLTWVPKDDKTAMPPIFIDLADIGYPGFYMKRLEKDDPNIATAGRDTSCCQYIDGDGKSCAKHAATDANGAIYALFQRAEDSVGQKLSEEDKIVAQCWAWRSNKKFNRKFDFVFDSVESNLNFRNKQPALLGDAFTFLAHKLVTEHPDIDRVIVGKGRYANTPKRIGVIELVKDDFATPDSTNKAHRDSKEDQAIIASKNFPYTLLYLSQNPDVPKAFAETLQRTGGIIDERAFKQYTALLMPLCIDLMAFVEPQDKDKLEKARQVKEQKLALLKSLLQLPRAKNIQVKDIRKGGDFTGVNLLFVAAQYNDTPIEMLRLLADHIDVDERDYYGRRVIEIIAEQYANNPNVYEHEKRDDAHFIARIKLLLNKGESKSLTEPEKQLISKALSNAIELNKDGAILQQLIDWIGPNQPDFKGKTPLETVLEKNNFEAFKILLKNKLEISQDFILSLLTRNDLSMAQRVLEFSPSNTINIILLKILYKLLFVDERDRSYLPLNSDELDKLLKEGNEFFGMIIDNYPLIASRIFRNLLKVEKYDHEGKSNIVKREQALAIAKYLINLGLNPMDRQMFALHYLPSTLQGAMDAEFSDMAILLIKEGAFVNELHVIQAIKMGSAALVDAMLKFGQPKIDPNDLARISYNALYEAIQVNSNIAIVLLKYGINPNILKYQKSETTYISNLADEPPLFDPAFGVEDPDAGAPLDYLREAAREDSTMEVTKEIDPNILEAPGDTPIMLAIRNDDKPLFNALIEAEADLTLKNKGEQTALMIAELLGRVEMIALIKKSLPSQESRAFTPALAAKLKKKPSSPWGKESDESDHLRPE